MSEAPERIWAVEFACGSNSWTANPMIGKYRKEMEYIRADLVEAAVKRALEGAANEVDCYGCYGQCADPANCHADYAKHIRQLDPAQFIDGGSDE